MKIGIISRGHALYSTRRIAEAGRRRNHVVRILDPHRMVIGVEDDGVVSYHDGLRLQGFDVIIPRIGVSTTEYGLAILRQFELNNSAVVNSSTSIRNSRDKFHAIQLMAAAGVGVPKTLYTQNGMAVRGMAERLGGTPVVLKFNQGTQGTGVIICDSEPALQSTAQALWSLDQNFTLQEFIKESEGEDIRMIVIGGEVVGSMRRTAAAGDFRSNLHRGGTSELFEPPQEYIDMALKAVATLGLDIAGVDILESDRGPLILEVNSSPGLNGIETTTRKDLAEKLIIFAEGLVS